MTDQVIGSFLAVILGAFVGWLAGWGEMKRDVLEQGKSITKIEVNMSAAQKDINDIKMEGFKADSGLDKRVTVMEEQHKEILQRIKR